MATLAQVIANRANAQLSTGPKTEEGKARAAENSFKDGFYAKAFVVRGDEQEAFDEMRDTLEATLQPLDIVSYDLFSQILHAAWNLHRLRELENKLYAASADPFDDAASQHKLEQIARHRTRFERSHRTALNLYQAHFTNMFNAVGSLPHTVVGSAPLIVSVHGVHRAHRNAQRLYRREDLLSPEELAKEKKEQERARQERVRKMGPAMGSDGRSYYADGTLADDRPRKSGPRIL